MFFFFPVNWECVTKTSQFHHVKAVHFRPFVALPLYVNVNHTHSFSLLNDVSAHEIASPGGFRMYVWDGKKEKLSTSNYPYFKL